MASMIGRAVSKAWSMLSSVGHIHRLAAMDASIRHLTSDKNKMSELIAELQVKTVGYSTGFNSLYIDRIPNKAADFEAWEPQDIHRAEHSMRDREFHRFFDIAMGFIALGAWEGEAARDSADYFEFGVCSANSARKAMAKARKWNLVDMHFHFFDSFKGMPANGDLAMSEELFRAVIDDELGYWSEKVETVPGFYNVSLTRELQQEFLSRPRRPGLITVDVDLYDSAVPVFKFITPLCRVGTIVFVDDFWGEFHHANNSFGTARAFFEFAHNHPTLDFHPFMRVGWWGMAYIAYEKGQFGVPVI